MIKKLRQNRKNKKGFTLVELIVVIVIILVLAAVMVPSVLRYITKANKANTKADAAAILVDLQAKVADDLSSKVTITAGSTKYTCAGQEVAVVATLSIPSASKPSATTAQCVIDLTTTSPTYGEITTFAYEDKQYNATWTKGQWAGTAIDDTVPSEK